MKISLAVLAVLLLMSVVVYFAHQERQRFLAEKEAEGIGDREQYGCFQYGDQEYCEVWVKTQFGWTLCYRTVPKSIPPEDISCHE